ncbi:MAG: PQQ-binding-like beta-propeller repeat protein [Pirellulales bacterium]|nr:PQQ-binding-like beta-propeller repeat protein [Pirellulales bacterium]
MSRQHDRRFRVVHVFVFLAGLFGLALATTSGAAEVSPEAESALQQIGMRRGICAVLGLPQHGGAGLVCEVARGSELLVYFQSPDSSEVEAVRKAAAEAGLLGNRLFADAGDCRHVHLADDLAGAVLVSPSVEKAIHDAELLRILHPLGKAVVGERRLVKPVPKGVDSWSHPYHGPDNNPQSTDQLARAPYLTQFLAEPMFCPMPEISVAAGGRVFRAFGHIAHKANQNAMLNTLICANAYNGTILWTRRLPEGFMIHRNTMIATPKTLYLADHRSCKLIDAASGEVTDEIVVPAGVSDGPVWKWMALVDGVLYALVGGQEVAISTEKSNVPGMGHWPWGMWQGHDYANPKTNFGFGRTFLALDPHTKKVLWTHRDADFFDSRGVCMRGNRIYGYSPGKFLACFDAKNGKVVYKNADAELLKAIGPEGKAQHYVTGYSTTTYIKCDDRFVFFAGPQRSRLVVARAEDGKLLWQKEHGNYQLVLRDDGIYAAGPQQAPSPARNVGYKLDYETGKVLAELPMRRACTRATGSVDSVFFRASGGTVRIVTATNDARHITPMRPPCHDGVIISDGHLFWGPWMCGCQLSLYGHIGLAPAGDFNFRPGVASSRLTTFADAASVEPLDAEHGDWPAYQGDNARSSTSATGIPRQVTHQWTFEVPSGGFPSAPVAAAGLVFFGDRQGAVRAIDAADGTLRWEAYAAGPVFFPPAIENGRLFVGSADGRVYAFEAATGRPLWTFRAAPADRWIPVYGKLISTWPVAGGVVAEDGAVYAAAGIAHYDGTHVYALDAATGKVKWCNDTSGATSAKTQSGVSLQGSLAIRHGELRFVGGGVHEEARYDLATGECLNPPHDVPNAVFHTAFYAYYPDYGEYTSLDCPLPDGTSLCYDITYEGSWHGNLMLLPALPAGTPRPVKPVSRWGVQWRRGQGPKTVWQQPADRLFNSLIVGGNVVLAAGHTGPDDAKASFLSAIKAEDGSELWRKDLPGAVVKGGTAVNRQGQIFVSLESGQVLAYGSDD